MTQLSEARKGNLTLEMKKVAKEENLNPQYILEGVRNGEIIIPKNLKHNLSYPKAIGKGVKTKVNTNLGLPLIMWIWIMN